MKSKCRILPDGTKMWFNYKNELHREDGPAVIYPSEFKVWYINGRLYIQTV